MFKKLPSKGNIMVKEYLERVNQSLEEIDRKWDEYVVDRLETLIGEYSELKQYLEDLDAGSGVFGALDEAVGNYQDVFEVLAGEEGIDPPKGESTSKVRVEDEKALPGPQDEE